MDWKTSNSIKNKTEYALQVSAYKQALRELTGLIPKKLWVIRLDKKTGMYEKGIITDARKAIRAYEYISKIYEYLNDGEEKLPIEVKEKKVLEL